MFCTRLHADFGILAKLTEIARLTCHSGRRTVLANLCPIRLTRLRNVRRSEGGVRWIAFIQKGYAVRRWPAGVRCGGPTVHRPGRMHGLRRLRSCLPVSAIFALDDLPEKWHSYIEKNANYVTGGKFQAACTQAEASNRMRSLFVRSSPAGQHGFGNNGTDSARPCQPSHGDDQMNDALCGPRPRRQGRGLCSRPSRRSYSSRR
jgi:hypothetical protein